MHFFNQTHLVNCKMIKPKLNTNERYIKFSRKLLTNNEEISYY